jgi:hypothetical protein
MKRLVIAALSLVAVFVVAGSALAATGTKASVVYDSTAANGSPTNQVSYGPAAYSFNSIGDKIGFAPGANRSLNSATVTLSSWACQQGSWSGKDCVTQTGATFPQEVTLKIYDAAHLSDSPIAQSTQTFNVPYRPSASPKCTGDNLGKWYTPAKDCKNGLASDVTFSFSHVTLPSQVVYAISYPMSSEASNSLNVAVTDQNPTIGTSIDNDLWIDGMQNPEFDGGYAASHHLTPAVQFKAGSGS